MDTNILIVPSLKFTCASDKNNKLPSPDVLVHKEDIGFMTKGLQETYFYWSIH